MGTSHGGEHGGSIQRRGQGLQIQGGGHQQEAQLGPQHLPGLTEQGQGQIEIARIGVVKVPDQSKLAKIGNGMFRAPAEAFSGRSQSTASVRQGFVEQSGVNEMQALLSATSAARDVETNIGMIQQQDRMLDRAINSLGRVT
jgi:flagellar basal-body rod protein FlgG